MREEYAQELIKQIVKREDEFVFTALSLYFGEPIKSKQDLEQHKDRMTVEYSPAGRKLFVDDVEVCWVSKPQIVADETDDFSMKIVVNQELKVLFDGL